MPNATNNSPGSELVASGAVIFQSMEIFPSNLNPAIFDPQLPVIETGATNLPTLMWYLWLERAWTDVNAVIHVAQLGVTFTPTIQVRSSRNAGLLDPGMTSQAPLPFSAPIALPVGVPVRVNIRAPVEDISFIIRTPINPTAGLNRIHFILAASQ